MDPYSSLSAGDKNVLLINHHHHVCLYDCISVWLSVCMSVPLEFWSRSSLGAVIKILPRYSMNWYETTKEARSRLSSRYILLYNLTRVVPSRKVWNAHTSAVSFPCKNLRIKWWKKFMKYFSYHIWKMSSISINLSFLFFF